MTASSTRLPAFSLGATPWTSLRETYVRLTRILSTRHAASRTRFITPAVCRGGPAHAGRPPIIPAWT